MGTMNEKQKDNLAVYHVEDGQRTLYMLLVDNIISTVVLAQHKKDVVYIALVDSSGCNRGFSALFIASILHCLSGLIVCFSHPKDDVILGNSALNPHKRIMESGELFNFWNRIFEQRCMNCSHRKTCSSQHDVRAARRNNCCFVSRWSNYPLANTIPYAKICEIRKFNDDPKSKFLLHLQNKKVCSIKAFFEGLLMRSDFNKGGLLFSQCYSRTSVPGDLNARIAEYMCGEYGISKTANYAYINGMDTEKGPGIPAISISTPLSGTQNINIIDHMLHALRALDFSSHTNSQHSTILFCTHFGIKLLFFECCKAKPPQIALCPTEVVKKIMPNRKM